MNYFLAKQEAEWQKGASLIHLGSSPNGNASASHYQSPKKCPTHSKAVKLNTNWFLFCILDAVTVLLFARCLWKSYETITKIKTQVQNGNSARSRGLGKMRMKSISLIAYSADKGKPSSYRLISACFGGLTSEWAP